MKRKHPSKCVHSFVKRPSKQSEGKHKEEEEKSDDDNDEENFLPDIPPPETSINLDPENADNIAENDEEMNNSFIDLTSSEMVDIKHCATEGMLVDLTGADPSGCNKSFEDQDNCEDTFSDITSTRTRRKKNLLDLPTFEDNDNSFSLPRRIYWESLLAGLELSVDFCILDARAREAERKIGRIADHVQDVHFNPHTEHIDATAFKSLPPDAPPDRHPIWIKGDGNCLTRALSRAYCGNDQMHMELRTRIVIEGVVNKRKYLSDSYMARGATYVERDQSLVSIYASYSDYYRNSMVLNDTTIENLYMLEMKDCTEMGSYMGLWQIAQAATVLQLAIKSVYPVGGDESMRKDFNRWFFPLDFTGSNEDAHLVVMWTPLRRNANPCHFVPLIEKRQKYAYISINVHICLCYLLLYIVLYLYNLFHIQNG